MCLRPPITQPNRAAHDGRSVAVISLRLQHGPKKKSLRPDEPLWFTAGGRRTSAATVTPAARETYCVEDFEIEADGNQLLRRCLARNVLSRLVDGNAPPTAEQLGALGVHELKVPLPPLGFSNFCQGVKGDARAIWDYLKPEHVEVPARVTSAGEHCYLAPSMVGRRFADPEIERFVMALFCAVQEQTGTEHIPQIHVNPYDLFHAHVFRSHARGQLGMLFHAKEYPRRNPHTFPYDLGHCQADSPLHVTERCMHMRNLLWIQGRMFALDVSGALQHLLWPETSPLCTLYEEDMGTPIADITCLAAQHAADTTTTTAISSGMEQSTMVMEGAYDVFVHPRGTPQHAAVARSSAEP